MITLLLAAILSATPSTDTVLVLKTGQALPVRSYVVSGLVAKIIDAKGTPMVMRADLIDLEATAKRTEATRAKAAADEQARLDAEAATRQAGDEARRRNAEHLARSSGVGGISVSEGAEWTPPADDGEVVGSVPMTSPETAPAADGGDWAGRVAALRAEYRAAKEARAAAAVEHDKVVVVHNAITNLAEKAVARAQIATYRSEMSAQEARMQSLRTAWDTLTSEARRAGVAPAVYRGGIDG